MKRAVLDSLLAAKAEGRPVVLATNLESGEQRLLDPARGETRFAERDLEDDLRAALAADTPRVLETEAGRLFLNIFNPPLKLVLVGAVHIAQALAPMARAADYAVSVVDPRGAFATAERFPGVELIEDWPDDYFKTYPPDTRTGVVTLTHDPKLDDAALGEALISPAFYIGALGSKKTHAARVERLEARGFDADAIGRIHAPVGLKIGGRTPAEIAVSIMAEMTQELRTGHALRNAPAG